MDEQPNIVLVKLDKVLAQLSLLHDDMQQVKGRLSALERQVANLGEAVAAQWDNFDKHAERLFKLEHP
jgi:uncharacterized protein YoxC